MFEQRHCRAAGFALLALFATTTLCGCLGLPKYTKHTAQGVKITVIHPDASTKVESEDRGSAGKELSRFVCWWKGDNPGRVEVEIEGLRLRVNKRDYGAIAAGDDVVIHAVNDLIVEVNEERRQRI